MIKETFGVMIVWLAAVSGFLTWNIADEKKAGENLAFNTGRAFFHLLLTARSWNAEHGGVYVPVTAHTPQNPYLTDPSRDVTTVNGLNLTKINPAYMTRQISEIAERRHGGIRFHITSLKPLRPANKPSAWEEQSLRSFERGVKETGEFFRTGAGAAFRYMAPLITEEKCLKCHAVQGYKTGDIRGGISVTVPGMVNRVSRSLLIGYGFAALLGCLLIVSGGMILDKKRSLLLQANQALRDGIKERQQIICQLKEAHDQVNTLSGIVPICMHCKGIRDDQGYWNQLEKFISEHTEAQFSHSICDRCMVKYYPEAID